MNKKIVHSVFEHIAATVPERNAVEESGGASITYRDLNYRANIIASLLVERGIGRDKLAAVLLPAGIGFSAAILGVMKAGGIFMPLDLALPRPRLHHILLHTTPSVIITDEACTAELQDMLVEFGLAECTKVLVIPPPDLPPLGGGVSPLTQRGRIKFTDLNFIADEWVRSPANVTSDGSNLPLISEPDDSCYVIYTSGSTGVPKFIEGWHKGLAHYCHWQATEFALNETSKISQMAPVTFEASLKDFFVALTCGATLCIPSPDVKENPARLIEWIESSALTLFQTVPSYLRLVTREVAAQGDKNRFPALKLLFQSGDTLYGKDVNLWRQTTGEHVELVNLYGPAEVTLLKSFHRIPPGELKPNEIVPIGKPISNTVILILNGDTLCSPGKIGEICVKSPFIVKGYYRSPELTAEKFVQNPLNAETRDIIYRTGDLGRYRADMTIEFIGRMDSQVKVHGNRIELAEIENVLLSCPQINQVVIVSHRTDEMENILACYYTEQEPVNQAELRELILSRLPDYMVPAYFIRMENLPLSLNGKIDRKALPKPEEMVITSYDEPITATEKGLAEIWCEVLGLGRVGACNPFIEIGGDSLKAIRVIARIYKLFSVEVSVRDFFACPTIRELASFVDAGRRKSYQRIAAIPEADSYELSHAQRRLWLLDQLESDSAAYNIASSFLIEGEFNITAFVAAVEVIHQRHETLRTVFVALDGMPRQMIIKDSRPVITIQDISALSNPVGVAQELFSAEASRSFDLAAGPLYRVTLLNLAEGRTAFIFAIHHIISDVWSLGVMIAELSDLYNGFLKSEKPVLPTLSIQYRDFAAWQNALLAADDTQNDRAYWLEKLGGVLPLLDLPADFPRPPVKTYAGATIRKYFEKNLSNRLRALATEQGVSLFVVLIAIVRVLILRYTGQSDLVIGSPVAGRTHPDLESQIGFFVNTLVLRDETLPEESFVQLLARVMETNTAAFDHQRYPFDLLVDELKVPRDVSRSPIFDLMVVLQNSGQIPFALNGAEVTEFEQLEDVSKFDIDFVFQEKGEEIELVIEYNSDLFLAERIERLSAHLVRVAEGAVNEPSCPISELPLLTDDELYQVLELFSGKSEILADSVEWSCVHKLIEEQVRKAPDAVAVIYDDSSLSYAELNERSNRLAHYLLELGVKGDTLVAICVERSLEMIVALLGVLKAGAAYLPLDPGYPPDRMEFMLQDTKASQLLTQKRLMPKLNSTGIRIFFLDAEQDDLTHYPPTNPETAVKPSNLAYLIYTSGSTGRPKGVAIEHHSISKHCHVIRDYYRLVPGDRAYQFFSFNFDASVEEILSTLSSGATLVLADHHLQSPEALNNDIERHAVTILHLPPLFFHEWLALNLTSHSTGRVRLINVGGDVLPKRTVDLWRKSPYGSNSAIRLINGYGPTEVTVHTSMYEVTEQIPQATVPIGRPLAGRTVYLLDSRLQPAPIGVGGEMHVGGACLARCYLNQPELTAERFIPDPFSGEPGARLYKSGDLARYLSDGNIEFLGRIDNQVKVRGFRIEVGEIEVALCLHPKIREAVVIVRKDQQGDKRLAAYITPSDGARLSVSDLTLHLKSILPIHMIPADFVTIDSFPMTTSGKLDRKALSDPRYEQLSGLELGTEYSVPRNELEQTVATVWEGVLGRSRIGIHDNYFALGGDSIRAIQIGSRLKLQGLKMEPLDIFQYPTVAGLSPRITKLKRIADQVSVSGPIPLTPIQKWLFEEHRTGLHHFNQSILLASPERLVEEHLAVLLDALLSHHDALRLSFTPGENGWQQENLPDVLASRLEVVDLTGDHDPVAALERHAASVQAGFDLAHPPLMTAVLYRLPDGDRLLLVVHHLAVDGVSWRILAEDILGGYAGLAAGRVLSLPGKSDSFKLWSEALSHYAVSDSLLRELDYWAAMTDRDVPPLPLMTAADVERGTVADFDEIHLCLTESKTVQLLTEANQAYRTEPADLLLTALAFSLSEWTGSRSHLVTLEGHGREDIGAELDISRTVGWFTSLYPHLLELPERENAGYRLRVVKEGLRGVPNHGVGYGVLRWLTDDSFKQGYEIPPLPQISFNYFGSFDADFGDGLFTPADEAQGDNVSPEFESSFALEYNCSIMGGLFSIYLRYDRRRVESVTADRLANSFIKHLRELIAHCCSQEEGGITPSDISYDGLDIDQLDALLEGLGE